MLGLLLRLAFVAAALIGAVLLFIYAAFVAVIFIPVVLLVLFLLRKKGVLQWTTVDVRTASQRRRDHPQSPPQVIDHDPNDVTLERKP
jgi:hypothetical protein